MASQASTKGNVNSKGKSWVEGAGEGGQLGLLPSSAFAFFENIFQV